MVNVGEVFIGAGSEDSGRLGKYEEDPEEDEEEGNPEGTANGLGRFPGTYGAPLDGGNGGVDVAPCPLEGEL